MENDVFDLSVAAIVHPHGKPSQVLLIKTPLLHVYHLPTIKGRFGVGLIRTLQKGMQHAHGLQLNDVNVLSAPCAVTETVIGRSHEVTLYYDADLEKDTMPRVGNHTLAWTFVNEKVASNLATNGELLPRHSSALRQALQWNLP